MMRTGIFLGTLMMTGLSASVSAQAGGPESAERAVKAPQQPAEAAQSTGEPADGDGRPWSATVSLNQDVFFGFYPTVAAGYEFVDDFEFTFYSILWTTSSFSFNDGGGGLWTEVGAGVATTMLDDSLRINPKIGVVNGTVLSGSSRPLVAEGIVPNITIDYDNEFVESQFYLGYYIALRGARENDFLHYWARAGLKPLAFTRSGAIGSLLSVGAQWEHLRLQRTQADNSEPHDVYMWIGPYVGFALPHGVSLRFAGGWDVKGSGQPDFYKASIGMAF